MAKLRLDQALVRLNLAPSRTKAKELITGAGVELRAEDRVQVVKDPAYMFDLDSTTQIALVEADLLKYVSRAGFKLAGALTHTHLNPKGFHCLDAGQSTGGFTQVLIEAGAAGVIGFDVGHGQLHADIKKMPEVSSFEGINAKEATRAPELREFLGQMDLVTGDLSFISGRMYFGELVHFLKNGGHFLMLVKPQFELDRSKLNKKGVVADAADYEKVKADVCGRIEVLGLKLVDYFESCIVGQDGNREFFIYATK